MIPNLDLVKSKNGLTEEQMSEAMRFILSGQASDEALGIFLSALHERGETIAEITGAAKVLREMASILKAPYGALDCCGTGGDKKGTYNISTAVAFVAAACGVPIAKHGNRASSSKSGAADVLEELGVNLGVPHDKLPEAMKNIGFAFLMAPLHHTGMKHVAEVRKNIGHRTIFNILGPLANPAGTRLQLIGVFDKELVPVMAEVLKNLGTKRAWVVHGSDGLDEITTCAETHIAILKEGIIEEKIINPADFGLEKPKDESRLLGGDATENAAALRAVLEGRKCPYRDIVLANAAAVIHIHNPEITLLNAVEKAKGAIDSGAAMQILKDYITFSREAMTS